jgi:predicted nucleotidyltransferase
MINRLEEHLIDSLKHFKDENIVGIFLHGSQNYGLDTENSDVDTKLIVAPTLEEIARNWKPVSTTFIRENNEHIDFKDVREYISLIRKQNYNFIEILFTDYCYVNGIYSPYWKKLINQRERIARMNPNRALHAMLGVANQKMKAMEHPYESKLEILRKYGYDPKQLHHLVRMDYFSEDYINGVSYKECMRPQGSRRDYLLDLKAGKYSLEEARDIANNAFTNVTNRVESYNNKYHETEDKAMVILLDDVRYEIIKTAIKEEISNG